MPAVSKSQQISAAIALQAKKGKISKNKLKGASKEMYESMSESQLEEFASTTHSGLPKHARSLRELGF